MSVQTDCQVRGTDGLILDLIYLEDRWKIHWRRQICHVVYGFPTQDQKILRKTESDIPSKVYQIPIHRNSTCWQIFDTHIVFQVIIFNYQKSIPLLLFFLKRVSPKRHRVGSLAWDTLISPPPPYRGVAMKTRTSFLESGQFYTHPRAMSLPGTTKVKLASLLHTNHQWRKTHKDPKVRLAAELALWCRRLQVWFPGTPMWAMSRKQAQSGCWLWPHQLLNGS